MVKTHLKKIKRWNKNLAAILIANLFFNVKKR